MLRTGMDQLRNEFRQQPSQILPSVEHPQLQRATQPVTRPAAQSTLPILSDQPITQSKQEEETLQQANAENTAEKSSGNKATFVKNTAQLSEIPRHMLSTTPRQVTTQQAENDTTIWPAISAYLGNITLWYITAMTTQEEDLLRRSQPSHDSQLGHCRRKIVRCIFRRIETV